MTTPTTGFRVHRFGEKVAFHTDDGPTVYMTAHQAAHFVQALSAVVVDISLSTFQKSTLKTVEHTEEA